MKKTIAILSILFWFAWLGDFFNYIEQPSNFKDGHFQKYDQYQAEKETGNNQ